MKFLKYLPGILFLLVILGRFVFPWVARFLVQKANEKGDVCDRCKSPMDRIDSSLYLLPLSFTQEHENSPEYYLRNISPIESEEKIPVGRRACWMHLLRCQNCGCQEVVVVDFLRVRGEDTIQCMDVFPYEKFEELYLYKKNSNK